jgi:cobalt-zinc-cadmium efflux system outer membrane protein
MGVWTSLRISGAIVAVAVAASCLSARVLAQGPPIESLTLGAAIDRALAANPGLAAGRLGRAVSAAALAVAGERLNPEVSVEIEKETPRQSVAVAWPVELGGKRARRMDVGRAARATGDAEIEAAIAQVRNEVRRRYFEAQVADARVAVLGELRDVAERAHATAQLRFERGDAPRLEVLQADLARNTADAEVTSAAGAARAARARLNTVMAVPLETVALLTTPIDPDRDVVTTVVVERARSASSEMQVLSRRIDEQRAKASLAAAQQVPDVTPTATLTHDSPPDFTYGWRGGLAVTVPLLTRHRAGVALEQATLAQLTAQRDAALARIIGDVTAAAAVARAQREAYLRYRDAIVPQARQVEELAQDSYRLGQTGLVALLQALQVSRDVRLRGIDAAAQFEAGLADLEQAMGAPLP